MERKVIRVHGIGVRGRAFRRSGQQIRRREVPPVVDMDFQPRLQREVPIPEQPRGPILRNRQRDGRGRDRVRGRLAVDTGDERLDVNPTPAPSTTRDARVPVQVDQRVRGVSNNRAEVRLPIARKRAAGDVRSHDQPSSGGVDRSSRRDAIPADAPMTAAVPTANRVKLSTASGFGAFIGATEPDARD